MYWFPHSVHRVVQLTLGFLDSYFNRNLKRQFDDYYNDNEHYIRIIKTDKFSIMTIETLYNFDKMTKQCEQTIEEKVLNRL